MKGPVRSLAIRLSWLILGTLAISLAAEQKPNLILLDRQLPDTDGFEVLSKLHKSKLTAKIPVVILSAGVSQLDRQNAISAGANAYLAKPLSLTTLQDLISQYC